MADINERMATVETEVTHIRESLAGHFTTTLDAIHKKVSEMCPLVKDNAYWVAKWKQAIFWIAIIATGGGLVATAFYLVRNLTVK